MCSYQLLGMMGNPAMQSMMTQMMQNPEMLRNMAGPMQSAMSQMQSNPEMLNQMINSNPVLAGNPQMADAMRQNLPQMMQQVIFSVVTPH